MPAKLETKGLTELSDFLVDAFTADEFRRLLINEFTLNIVTELPESVESPRSLMFGRVMALARRGLIIRQFFDAIIRERPHRRREIERISRDFGCADEEQTVVWSRRRPGVRSTSRCVAQRLRGRLGVVLICNVLPLLLATLYAYQTDLFATYQEARRHADDSGSLEASYVSIDRQLKRLSDLRERVKLLVALVEVVSDDDFTRTWSDVEVRALMRPLLFGLQILELEVKDITDELRTAHAADRVDTWRAQDDPSREPDIGFDRVVPFSSPPQQPPARIEPLSLRPRPRPRARLPSRRYEEAVPVIHPVIGIDNVREATGALHLNSSPPIQVQVERSKPSTRLDPAAIAALLRAHVLWWPKPDEYALRATRTGRFTKQQGFNRTAYCVGPDGRPIHVTTVRAFPGDPEVDRICRETVATWGFRPISDREGNPIEVCTEATFDINFSGRGIASE